MKHFSPLFAFLGLLIACTEMEKPAAEIAATAISLDKKEIILEEGANETLTATVEPDNTTDKLDWSSSTEDIATVKDGVVTAVAKGSATITAKAGAQTATCTIFVAAKMKAIDLGLSVKWAECNLGATTPEEYGDYFAWGEVEPYYIRQKPITWKEGKEEGYSWASYKWANGASIKLTKYCPTNMTDFWDGDGELDGKTVLNPEDDAARVILGGRWRIPTKAEQEDLINKCTWTWDDIKNGFTVTGTNGNSIFLPAAWYRYDTYTPSYDNYYAGLYLSSSLNEIYPCYAYGLMFTSLFNRSHIEMAGAINRCQGVTVRPVTE